MASSAELSTCENALETIRLSLSEVEREIDGVQQGTLRCSAFRKIV